jgi:hypothetical protein
MSLRLPFPSPADGWHCQLAGAMSNLEVDHEKFRNRSRSLFAHASAISFSTVSLHGIHSCRVRPEEQRLVQQLECFRALAFYGPTH